MAKLQPVTLHLPPSASAADRMMARDVMAAMAADLAGDVIADPRQVKLPDGWRIVVGEPEPVADLDRRARHVMAIGYGIVCLIMLFFVLVLAYQ